MINQNFSQSAPQETTISRQTRNAFVTAVVVSLGALVNFFLSVRVSFSTHSIVSYIDTIVVFVFVLIAISSAVLVRKGERERGVWRLIISLAIMLGIRNFVNVGMGAFFSVLTIVLIPLVALLTLKQKDFNRALAVGIFAGAIYLIFDILISRFLPPYRQGGETIAPLIQMITIMSGLLTTMALIVFLRQSRFLLLSSKLTLAMVLVVLIPLIILGVASTTSLRSSLEPRQNEVMLSRSAFLAQNINYFLETAKLTVNGEAQSPAITEYALAEPRLGATERQQEIALETLLSYRRKDVLHIVSYAVLDIHGENILDTVHANIGKNESDELYFQEVVNTGLPYVSDIQRGSRSDQYYIFFSAPIYYATSGNVGVLRAQYNVEVLQQYLDQYNELNFDKTQELFAALLYKIAANPITTDDPDFVYFVIANSLNPSFNYKSATRLTTNIITPLQTGGLLPPGNTAQLSLNLYGLGEGLQNWSGNDVFSAQAFPRENEVDHALDMVAAIGIAEKPEWVVITSQTITSVDAPLQQQREATTLLTVLVSIGAAVLAYAGSRYLINPILNLTEIADRVAEGDFSVRAVINTEDEIGTLSNAFNTMTSQLNTLITTLEERVASRTEDIERRSKQLRAAVEVGKVAVSLRNLDNLLTQATELISLRFGFYHVGIFLLDDKEEYAVLRAANSEGGARMLSRNHKLQVGQVGIVGYVTKTGQARIALDVGQDAVYFDNPDLPQTRSEMALALIAGGRILGALDIQSTQGEAFSDTDITTLQVLADQIAISIENARLFEENRNALQALRRAYGEQSHIGWQELMHTRKLYGYQSKADGKLVQLTELPSQDIMESSQKNEVVLDDIKSTANVPIVVRGNIIGMLRLAKPETAHPWNDNELELAKSLSTELSGALDSARLFDETRKQAEQEFVVGEITNKMRETMNVESVIKMAADEIYKLLDLENISIHFTPEDESHEKEDAA